MVSPSQKLVDYGIIAALLGGAYVLWKYIYSADTPKTCQKGYHYVDVCADAATGAGKQLCNLGRNIIGGSGFDCQPDPITCPPGYTVKDGQCTAPNPGGCAITAASCIASEMYLDEATCTCMSPQVGYLCADKDRPTEARRLVAKLNAGECLTSDELAWANTCEKALYTIALACVPDSSIKWKQCRDILVYPGMTCPEDVEKSTLACNDGSYVQPSKGCPIVPKTCWDGSVIDLNSGICPTKPDPSTYLKQCDCGVNGKMTIDTRTGTCEDACPPVDFFVPVPVPSIECKAGRYNALSNRPGRLDGFGMSELGCYAQGGDQWTKAGGRCTNALDRERQAYIDACGFV